MRQNERGDYIPNASEAVAIALANRQTEEQSAPLPETPADVRKRVEANLTALRSRLTAVFNAAQRGDVQTVTDCDFRDLTIQIASEENARALACEAEAEAERAANLELREQSERNFSQAVEKALRARTEAQRHFRDCAVSLGLWCTAVREAIEEHSNLRTAFPDPDRMNILRDLENRALLSPLNELLDAGYSVLRDFGFDLQITVPPLLPPGRKENLQHDVFITLPERKK